MKCPICLTNVVNNECPNCGYKIKKIQSNTFDVHSQTHEHIREYKHKKKLKFDQPAKKSNLIMKIVIIIILVTGFVLFVAIPSANRFLGSFFDSQMTYQEIIEEGLDDEKNIENIMIYQNEFISFLDENDYTYSQNEKYSKGLLGYPSSATTEFVISDIGYPQYQVEIVFQNGELHDMTVLISGEVVNSINHTELIDKEFFDSLTRQLGMDDAYDEINKGLSLMAEKTSGNRIYESEDKYDIYMIEQIPKVINGTSNSYEYRYTISLK